MRQFLYYDYVLSCKNVIFVHFKQKKIEIKNRLTFVGTEILENILKGKSLICAYFLIILNPKLTVYLNKSIKAHCTALSDYDHATQLL